MLPLYSLPTQNEPARYMGVDYGAPDICLRIYIARASGSHRWVEPPGCHGCEFPWQPRLLCTTKTLSPWFQRFVCFLFFCNPGTHIWNNKITSLRVVYMDRHRYRTVQRFIVSMVTAKRHMSQLVCKVSVRKVWEKPVKIEIYWDLYRECPVRLSFQFLRAFVFPWVLGLLLWSSAINHVLL